ncbi:MAG: hypothetical protein AMXMBFR61_09710 [Fimbriimonadales bacterium]
MVNDNPFRWNGSVGYRYIASTGLYHAGAREYDPTVGRWLQRDPIGMAGGHPNLYVYCANNPVEAADPDGLRHFSALGRATNLPDEKSWWDRVVSGTEWLLSLPWNALKWALGYNQTKLAPGTTGFGAITGDPYRDGTEEGDELADLIDQYGAGSRAIGQTAARGAEQVLENYVGIGVAIAGATGGEGWQSPFKGKSPRELDEMFRKKGFVVRGPDPVSGRGGYVNPRSGFSYHLDPDHGPPFGPHVDVNYPRVPGQPRPEKRRWPMQ